MSSIIATLQYLETHIQQYELPMGNSIAAEYKKDPFHLLIACLLSLRTRDVISYGVSRRLFEVVSTPSELIAYPREAVEAILKPIGFYRTKTAVLYNVSRVLCDRYQGIIPVTREALLSLPGVGRKTANFMLCLAFDVPAICVDTHVHRLANKFGWVQTRSPEETEQGLEKLIPSAWWCRVNTILVVWGQRVCTPLLAQKNRMAHDRICPCVVRDLS